MNQMAIAQPENSLINSFIFEGNQVRTTAVNGDPWFVAVDLCNALDIRNNRDAIARLDEDEKGVATTDTPGGAQEMLVVNESGMYSLVLTSRKPEAKRFKKWVTSVLIPGIRKKEFVHVSQMPAPLEVLAQISESYTSLKQDMEELKQFIFSGKVPAKAPEVITPPGEMSKKEIKERGLMSPVELAKRLDMTTPRLHAILEVLGIQSRIANRYFTTDKARGHFEIVGSVPTRKKGNLDKFLWKESVIALIPKQYLS